MRDRLMNQTETLLLAERSVPRYTSYPTAPHFHAGIGPPQAHAWLAALVPDATLSLYLHVPYCAAMCSHCGCHTQVTRRAEPIAAYTEALLAEIALLARSTAARRVTHLHWGGGTPSMLRYSLLGALAGAGVGLVRQVIGLRFCWPGCWRWRRC